MSPQRKALFYLILATSFWGLSFPLAKALWMIQGGGSLNLAASSIFLRFFIGAGILGLYLRLYARAPIGATSSEHRQAFLLAFSGGLGILLQMDALQYTAASTSAFLTQSYCILLPWFYCFNQKKFPTFTVLGSTALVMIGMLLLCGVNFSSFNLGRGEYETLLASFIFTFQILVLEKKEFSRNHMGRVTFWMFLWVAGLMLFKIAAFGAQEIPQLLRAYSTSAAWGLTLVLTLFATVISFALMNQWQPYVTSVEAGLIYALEPIFASCYALYLPGILARSLSVSYANETLSKELLLGGALITAANVWLQAAKKSKS